ncbi:MAG: hypothetical protein Q9213_000496 [Squamulea squamosa]
MSDSIRAIAHNDRSRLDGNSFLHEVSEFHPLATLERYYPFAEAATNALRTPNTKPAYTLELQKITSGSQSAGSSVGASTSDPMTPYSTGLTPPSVMKMGKAQNERSLPQIPMSTSPEQYNHTHRSSSNLASAFTSMVRPFSFSTPDSSSPPIAYSRKRISPTASYRSAVNSNSALPHTDQSGTAITKSVPLRTRPSSSPIHDERTSTSKRQSTFQTALKNQDQFDNDGYAVESLLDPAKEELYTAYRSSYASMLFSWELPVARSKVLQYNKPHPSESYSQNEREDHWVTRSLTAVAKDLPDHAARAETELRLDLRDHCTNCSNVLLSNSRVTKCTECLTKKAPVVCQLCHGVVFGLSFPCLNCGHVLHIACRSALEQDEGASLDSECVTGCGCHCTGYSYVKVQPPELTDESTPLISATNILSNEQEELGWDDVTEESKHVDDEAWNEVAYKSLMRNLGARTLTPRPSQIWRGGETRKASISGVPDVRRSGPG